MDHPVSKRSAALLGAVLVLLPATAWADPGLPMLVLVWPASVFVLGPIIAVETWHGQKIGFSRELAWKVATKANIVSTLGGIPLAWLGMLALQFVTTYPLVAAGANLPRGVWYYGIYWTLGAAWLAPTDAAWHVPAATAVLCIPFYLVAVPMEAWVARRSLPPDLTPLAKVWSRGANRLSYGMLIGGLALAALVLGLMGTKSNV